MSVALIPIGAGADRHLQGVRAGVAAALRCPVAIAAERLEAEGFYDAGRGQYWSTPMLEALTGLRPQGSERVLGVAVVDLFVPVLTFVFGEALLEGAAAVVSAHRLNPEVYGLPPDPQRLAARVVKEAVHELGHTYGLRHCRHPACVMRASRAADDIDDKETGFCPRCAAWLEQRGAPRAAVV